MYKFPLTVWICYKIDVATRSMAKN